MVLTEVVGLFAQQTIQRSAAASSLASPTSLLSGAGRLSVRQFELPSILERFDPDTSFEALVGHEVFMPEVSTVLAEELEVLGQSSAELRAHELQQVPSVLAEKRAVVRTRFEAPKPDAAVQPFLFAVRGLIESEQLSAARHLLHAVPAYILSDPLVVKLRSVLAPPVVKQIDKRDVDRSQEYDWLRTEGHKFRGRWVALERNQLLASAPSLRKLQRP